MPGPSDHFLKPTAIERAVNKTVGILARWGLGPSYVHLLEVRGYKTGKTYSTPVNLLELHGRRYLVGGRGHTSWSKNARVTGEVTLRRGNKSVIYRANAVLDTDKPEILKTYLETYPNTVQRFFSVAAGSPVERFRSIADRHPVFELVRMRM